MKILIIKTSSMGDVIQTLPALTDAVKFYPNIQFDWVIEEDFMEIPHWHQTIKHIFPIAIRRWKKNWFTKSVCQERKNFYNQLLQQQYDIIIDAQGLLKNLFFIVRLTNGNIHGYNLTTVREPLVSMFYNYRYYINKQLHAVERIRLLFAKSLHYTKPNVIGNYGIESFFSSLYLTKINCAYVILFHATTRNKKHWPESHWRQLIADIQNEGLMVKIPWLSSLEYKRAIKLATGFKHVEILPKLSLNELAKQIIKSKLVISVDTGLSHLTAALGKPNITLYGPTKPELIGVYGKKQRTIISVDGNMATIKPNEVYQQLISFITSKIF